MPILLGIPVWAWISGGAVAGGAVLLDQAGDAAEQSAVALDSATRLGRVLVIGGALYIGYRVLKTGGKI